MHVTKWGEYGILCSMFLARRFLAARDGEAITSPEATSPEALQRNGSALRDSSGPVGALEVAEKLGIPAQYTQQILQRLRRGDIVKSVRGAHGGYTLSRPPSAITLLDIMTAAEGSTFDVMCETSPAYPIDGQRDSCIEATLIGGCNLKQVWIDVRNAVDAVLTGRTLESLAHDNTAHDTAGAALVQLSFAKRIEKDSTAQFNSRANSRGKSEGKSRAHAQAK